MLQRCASVPLQIRQRGFKRRSFWISRRDSEDESPANSPDAFPPAPGEPWQKGMNETKYFILSFARDKGALLWKLQLIDFIRWNYFATVHCFVFFPFPFLVWKLFFFSPSFIGERHDIHYITLNDNYINSKHEILVDRVISSKFTGQHETIKSYMGISLFCVIWICELLTLMNDIFFLAFIKINYSSSPLQIWWFNSCNSCINVL